MSRRETAPPPAGDPDAGASGTSTVLRGLRVTLHVSFAAMLAVGLARASERLRPRIVFPDPVAARVSAALIKDPI